MARVLPIKLERFDKDTRSSNSLEVENVVQIRNTVDQTNNESNRNGIVKDSIHVLCVSVIFLLIWVGFVCATIFYHKLLVNKILNFNI